MDSPLPLHGKKALITGIANEHSLAYGCAKAFCALGGEVMITYQSERSLPYITPLLESLNMPLALACDVRDDGALEAVFTQAKARWGALDMALHSIAFAPREDLHGRVTDVSREGFLEAMDVSCYSFIRMAKLAESLMAEGGALFTLSYYGAEKVVEHYGLMGPVKAALESTTRYLASELGAKRIRVNAISPGPVHTRAASGIKDFEALANAAETRAPLHHLVTIEEVGSMVAWLSADALGRSITGQVIHMDAGLHILA
jgi:enoyl-[acyl-carrier protein] reductase I